MAICELDGHLTLRAECPPRQGEAGRARQGSEMGSMRFSPDRARLAFGLGARPMHVIMDVCQRRVERVVTVDGPQERSLCCLNFTPDSKYPYLDGAHAGQWPTPLYRIDLSRAAAPPERLNVGRQRFTKLPLPGGDVVFCTDAPSLARIGTNGELRAPALPPNGDFRFDWTQFRVSGDASRLSLLILRTAVEPAPMEVASALARV